jgi:hypothetical protein
MKLVTAFAMAALILMICGCGSLSTCRYRSTGFVVFPTAQRSPLSPLLEDAIKGALTPLGFSAGAPRALPNSNPLTIYSIGGSKIFGERVDVIVDLQTAQVTVFDFNNTTGNPASKFDKQIMSALRGGIKEKYGASLEFKPGDERFCLGP